MATKRQPTAAAPHDRTALAKLARRALAGEAQARDELQASEEFEAAVELLWADEAVREEFGERRYLSAFLRHAVPAPKPAASAIDAVDRAAAELGAGARIDETVEMLWRDPAVREEFTEPRHLRAYLRHPVHA